MWWSVGIEAVMRCGLIEQQTACATWLAENEDLLRF
jgi:hypothetical protein